MNTKNLYEVAADVIATAQTNRSDLNSSDFAARKGILSFEPQSSPFSDEMQAELIQSTHEKTAAWVCEKILEQIRHFEDGLNSEEEIGAQLASFGKDVIVHLRTVKAVQPNMIVFDGITENDEPATLMQHMNQLSVLFVKLKKQGPNANRIGYVHFDGKENHRISS